MKLPRSKSNIKVIVLPLLLVGVLVACGVYPETSRGPLPSPLSRLASPVITPTPLGYVEPTRTPTPTRDVNYDPAKVTPGPTWTPTATPVNLASGWPRMLTYFFTVERANGQREHYIVPVGSVPMIRTESDLPVYLAYIDSVANLGPGDRYIGGCAASAWMFMVPPHMICFTKYSPLPGPELLTPSPTP